METKEKFSAYICKILIKKSFGVFYPHDHGILFTFHLPVRQDKEVAQQGRQGEAAHGNTDSRKEKGSHSDLTA